jgi:filamentous hemagglutinin
MLLDTLGKRYDIDEIKKLAEFSEEWGTEMGNLASALQRLGIENARLEHFPSVKDLARQLDDDHPVIARVKLIPNRRGESGYHGVVVDRIRLKPESEWEGAVFIRDPAGGREYLSPLREFEKKFDGNAIVTKAEKQ